METLEITDTKKQMKEERNMDASIFNFKQKCNELKAVFVRKYPVLSMDDLHCGNGDKESMMDRLQHKLGLSEDELHKIIVNLQ